MTNAPELVTTTPNELADRIDAAHQRFATLLAPNPEAHAMGGDWRAVDVAGHLVNVVNRYVDFAPERLAADPRGVDAINDQELAALGGRSMADVLTDLADELDRFQAVWGPQTNRPLDLDLPFHGGATISLQAGLTNLLAEFLVHGLDVARAAGADWPIEARDGALIVAFEAEIVPAYVRATNTEHLHVRLDPEGVDPWVLDIAGPEATSRRPAPDDRPDVCLRGPATPLALLIYRRLTLEGACAEGVEVGGARPERAARFPDLLEEP